MKKRLLFLGITSLSFGLISSLTAVEVTGIAAKINGKVITKNEVNYHLTPYKQQLDASTPRKGEEYHNLLKDAKKRILDDLIERELILSDFRVKTNNNGIPARAIDSELDRQIRDNFNNNREEFNKALKSAGITPEQNRREVEKKLIVQAMRAEQLRNAIPPLPDEVQAEYKEHKNKMRNITGDSLEYHKIYITKQDPQNPLITPQSQLELAEGIVEKIKSGTPFADLAKEHSADSYAEDGGKVEKTKRTDLSAAFASILMDTPEGEILGPLEDQYGYTIVKLDKKYYGPAPELSEVRNQMESRVRARKNKLKQDRWIKRLRNTAMIEIKN